MDRALRELERAARVDPVARERLDHALDHIGRQALVFRGPDPVPRVRRPGPRRSRGGREQLPEWGCRLCKGRCIDDRRHRLSRRLVEKRRRRAGRAACREWQG